MTELIPFLLQYGLMTKAGNRYVLDGTSYTEDSFTKMVKSDYSVLTTLIEKVKVEVGKRHSISTPQDEVEEDEAEVEESTVKAHKQPTPKKVPVKMKVRGK